MSGVLLVHQAWLTRRNVERSAAKPRGPKPFEACAAGQTFCTRQTVAASLLLCLRGWNSGWGDLTLRHAPASATAVLGWTAVKAEPVCYLQWMRKDSVGPYPFFGSSFED